MSPLIDSCLWSSDFITYHCGPSDTAPVELGLLFGRLSDGQLLPTPNRGHLIRLHEGTTDLGRTVIEHLLPTPISFFSPTPQVAPSYSLFVRLSIRSPCPVTNTEGGGSIQTSRLDVLPSLNLQPLLYLPSLLHHGDGDDATDCSHQLWRWVWRSTPRLRHLPAARPLPL